MTQKPVVFLDIDGVLNSHQFYKQPDYLVNKQKLKKQLGDAWDHHHDDIDPLAVERINKLVDYTGATIVLSSTWRSSGLALVNRVLKDHGLKYDLQGVTPYGCGDCLRGNEILTWIKNNKALIGEHASDYKRYVILDDDSDMLYWQRNNFIHINGDFGLSDRDVYFAKRILGPADTHNQPLEDNRLK